MKTITLQLYTFDELSEEVQKEIIERERWNIMDQCMEAYGSDYVTSLRTFEKLTNTQYDRRIKLTPDQKEYIKWLREKQLISYSKLAKIFGVSKRLIQFICCPDKYLKNKESLKQRKAEGRYKPTKAEWAATIREHRRYKEQLKKKGDIK